MKHLKTFENNGYKDGPQVGDYVSIRQEPNNIGVITKIYIYFNNGTEEEFEYDINYSDLEEGDVVNYRIDFFTEDEDEDEYYYYYLLDFIDINAYSDNKSDLEIKLNSNKYNL